MKHPRRSAAPRQSMPAYRLLRLLRQEGRALLVVGLLLIVGSVSLAAWAPKALGAATDVIVRGMTGSRHVDFTALHWRLGIAAALFAGASLLNFLTACVTTAVVQRAMSRLRADVEDKIHRLPLSYVDVMPRGDLLSRVTNDVDNLQQSLQQTISQILTATLTVVATLAMMLSISVPLAVVALLGAPLSSLVIRSLTLRARSGFASQWESTGELNTLAEESVTGHEVIRAFGRQHEVLESFTAVNDRLFDASFRAQATAGSVGPVMMVVSNATFLSVCVLGGLRVASGQLTLGSVQAFIQYSRQFSAPLGQIAQLVSTLQSGLASAERLYAFLDAPEEKPDRTTATLSSRSAGEITFDRVCFGYQPDRPLIEDLSLRVPPGSTLAIVGPTGAGKTTLVNLLLRFYDLSSGRILLDGIDVSELPRAQLRSNVAMVLQDTWLFRGSVRDNIAYGRPSASEADIQRAARDARVDSFVHTLPQGYDTLVDDEETPLSAGEKQLVTIARAFLADPAVLILDEATSSVDSRTELLVQEAMAALRADRTCLVIAHRLSTIRDADTIVVMDAGSIVEQGSHDDLVACDGRYAELLRWVGGEPSSPSAARPA